MKRISALLLVLLLVFVSCEKEETPEKEENKNNETVQVIEGDIFAERAAIDDELPEEDFGGREFRVVGHSPSEFYIPADGVNKGNLLDDAKAKRNTLIEERFNVNIVCTYSGGIVEVNDWVTKSVLSGVDEFDLLHSHSLTTGGMVTKNLFVNWYDVPHINFSKPWWAASTSTDLTYDGKCIVAISDYNTSAISCTYTMVFNKDLANAYDIGNIYDVVFAGDWTFDYFYNLVKDIYVDLDGSTDRSEPDFYGMSQGDYCLLPWLYAFDNPIMKKNEDGAPEISLKTEKINSIISVLYDYCFNTEGVFYDPEIGQVDHFLEKRSIFTITSIGDFLREGFRNFEDEYGVLPMPKWESTQSQYQTVSLGEHTALAVPKTAKDLEFVGILTEALSAESYKQVTPTYYEIALKTRYLRDNESKKVLDIVTRGQIYDFGYIYSDWKAFGSPLEVLFGSKSDNFESYYQKNYPMSRIHYRSILKAFDRL